ncbi:Putative exodeoxyribonuclease 8, PDDEXK-like domain containing protein [uncultured Caudovirales phage]|uniref:Exodeoxyribonuclease 8, PDDEXK-like domain containing protein n=1 Tax=uncultured Caudovirales phage TaxID=2100421 RepID=A0A6J5QUF1_9CAUD|nr:Putative exodeoxyribonuclease 8, PDDEXK-like domain containing protein [uncultured Caudovirales phage]
MIRTANYNFHQPKQPTNQTKTIMLNPSTTIIPTRKAYDSLVALNCSGSKELLKSPLHFQAYLRREQSDSKALRMGSFIHALVLEPSEVEGRFATAPEVDRRTKDGKAAYEAFAATSLGKTILSPDETDVCLKVAASMRATQAELGVTFIKTELMFSVDYNGVLLKCAIDALGDDGFIYDLKSAESSSVKDFKSSVFAYRYHLQAVMYRMAYEAAFNTRLKGFRFIVTEKTDPFASACYELGPEFMSLALMDFEIALAAYKSCMALGEWPGYGSAPQVIDIASKPSAPASIPIQFA